MPPDPPRRLVLRTPGYLMAMQFQKQPIKFTFDWLFCPSNNFPLYCTLGILQASRDHYNLNKEDNHLNLIPNNIII